MTQRRTPLLLSVIGLALVVTSSAVPAAACSTDTDGGGGDALGCLKAAEVTPPGGGWMSFVRVTTRSGSWIAPPA